jgi:hypothetical protein
MKKTKGLTILDIIKDVNLFGQVFRGLSWVAWTAFLACLFGLPMDAEQGLIARRATGRQILPTAQAREAALIIGRRGGKSRMAALIAVFLSCFQDYAAVLAPGERGTFMLIASDRRQARVLKHYVSGLLKAVPMLEQMIVKETAESIELNHRILIEIHTASFRSVRGYTIVGGIVDEIAFMPTDGAANPDSELIAALRPAGATVPRFLLLMISSPYARRGELWRAYKEHFGKDGDPILVWKADTQTMNPLVPESVIAAAYEADPASATAEYGANFRADVESFITLEIIHACTVPQRLEVPPLPERLYSAFTDTSGGVKDAFTLAIAHTDHGIAVLDLVREIRPPFSPEAVVAEFAAVLKQYNITSVMGDSYAGLWPREQFLRHELDYRTSDLNRSSLYLELLPLLTSRRVQLLDDQRLLNQLANLERRTGRSSKDTVDHGPTGSDDVINSAAGALVLAWRRATEAPLCLLNIEMESADEAMEREKEEIRQIRRKLWQEQLLRDGYIGGFADDVGPRLGGWG